MGHVLGKTSRSVLQEPQDNSPEKAECFGVSCFGHPKKFVFLLVKFRKFQVQVDISWPLADFKRH